MDGRAQVSRSLERELTRSLGIAILATGIAAAAAALVFGYDQAQDLQDEALRQIALSLVRSAAGDAGVAADSAERRDADPELRVLVVRLQSAQRPPWLAADLAPGFHTLAAPGAPMRVYVRGDGNARIAIAQSTEMRRESALYGAAITLAPLLVLLPLLVWLARRITRTELASLRELAVRVDSQLTQHPQPLPLDDVPVEVGSFVHAINGLLIRIKELIAVQRRFIADAAHELRSPLTALAVQAANLAHAPSPGALRERIDALKAGIERARHLTEQLLDLARLQADAGGKEAVDVSSIVRDAIAACLPLAEQRGIDVGMEELEALTLWAHAPSLTLVVKNALDNAVRYSPHGGQVTVRVATIGEQGVVEVIDSGPGIPARERGRIFAPFYRAAGAPGAGSGLGLAIARDAAERCGGSIEIEERRDGTGTIFRYSQDLGRAGR
jgi:two-component system OmpR family sensor kinase